MNGDARNMNNRYQMLAALVCLAAMGLVTQLSARAAEASFDCSKASLPIEKGICESGELRDLDRKLNEKYRAVLAAMDAGRRAALIKDQRAWLEHRNESSIPIQYLASEYELRLKDLDIARNPKAFTAAGWSDPVIVGAAFDALDAQTRRQIASEVARAFQPMRVADSLAGLASRDTFTGELLFSFGSRPICDDLSGFAVAASRKFEENRYGKTYTFWAGVFYQNRILVPKLEIEPDAVLSCSSTDTAITVDVNDD